MTANNYISRRKQLLKSFNRLMTRSKQVLRSRYGNEQANSLISESRCEYEALIPKIPFLGNRSPQLIYLILPIRYLAIYQVLSRNGFSLEESGQVIYLMNEAELKAIPILLRRIVSYVSFSPLFIRYIRKLAKESQARKYPGAFVWTFIEGDGQKFDYGIDITECAVFKFLDQQGAPELAPFICSLDQSLSEVLGWGLTRTTTIAAGYEKCDSRYKKGGKTNIISSPIIMQR